MENEIKTLKGKTAEINKKTESQKTEIAHIYSLSKGKLTKGEKQLEKLKKGSEELRGQVLCLQEEKKGLAGAVDEHQLFVARHRIEMERLENKIKEQEEKMSNCQAQSSENTQGIEVSYSYTERHTEASHFIMRDGFVSFLIMFFKNISVIFFLCVCGFQKLFSEMFLFLFFSLLRVFL